MLRSVQRTIRVWLGGSFDPVHVGHLAILQHIETVLSPLTPLPKSLAFLPTAGSPLKHRPTPADIRLAMLQLAVAELAKLNDTTAAPVFTIDTTELYQPAPVYTFNTLQCLQQRFPDDIRIFVLGEDSVLNLISWYRGLELTRWAHLWVIPRARSSRLSLGERQTLCHQLHPSLQNSVTFLPASLLNNLINPYQHLIYIDDFAPPCVASSQIRIAIANGEPLIGLPITLQRFISERQLYH